MEIPKSRLPIFISIHKKGLAEENERIKREEADRMFWRKMGMVDHRLDMSDADTDQEEEEEEEQFSDGGKKNNSNRKYTRKYTMKKRTNKNKKLKKRWSLKYKRSINCKRPRGFSQRQYCKYGRKK